MLTHAKRQSLFYKRQQSVQFQVGVGPPSSLPLFWCRALRRHAGFQTIVIYCTLYFKALL